MFSYKNFTLLLVILLAFFVSPASAQSFKLSLSETLDTQAQKHYEAREEKTGEPEPTGTKKSNAEIVLYPDAFSLRRENEEFIYDFGKKVLYAVNHSDKTIQETPLYPFPLFENQEKNFQARNMVLIASLIASKKITQPMPELEVVDLDMLYGGDKTAEASGKTITPGESNGEKTFSHGKRTLASYTESGTPVPADLRKTYERMLVYIFNIHPAIRHAIADDPNFFSTLKFTNRDLTSTTNSSYTVGDLAPSTESAPVIHQKDYKKIYSADERLNVVIERSMLEIPSFNDCKKQLESYVQKGQMVEAVFMFYQMATMFPPGDVEQNMPALAASLKSALNDPLAARVMAAARSNASTPEELKQAIETLDEGAKAAPETGFVAEIAKANHIRNVYGKKQGVSEEERKLLEQSRDMYLAALHKNPWHAGAYADLGNAYYADFEIPTAWICWENARRLNPGLPQNQNIQSMEQRIPQDFPEYF